VGGGSAYASFGSSSVAFAGLSENLAFGWALSPKLVLYGDIGGILGGNYSTSAYGSTSGLTAFGVGLTYYFPSNMFVGGGIEAPRIGVGTDKSEALRDTNLGLGLNLEYGKEWWVSANWALGWALRLGFVVADDRVATGTTWFGQTFAVLFSATYN
jgi:hypothetical protein